MTNRIQDAMIDRIARKQGRVRVALVGGGTAEVSIPSGRTWRLLRSGRLRWLGYRRHDWSGR